MTRALLVEVIAADRFHRSPLFPFVHGLLRSSGVDSLWLRLALPARWRADHHAAGIELEAPALDALVRAAGDRRATHVLFNEQPGAGLTAALAQLPGAPRLALLGDGARPETTDCALVAPTLPALAGFFALPSQGRGPNPWDAITPDYGWTAGNAAARSCEPLPFVICGEECSYQRPLAANPTFAGIDLAGCVRTGGCAFCMRPPGGNEWNDAPMVIARRQLEALAATHPPFPGRPVIRAVGQPILSNVEAFAELLLDLDLPPADLLLDARADTLRAAEPALRRALAALAGSGHVLHVALVGIESFVDAELVRLNKGTRWQTNLDAIASLMAIERDHPRGFAFREHRGLSLILLTPWTTLDDLALNLAIIETAGLDALCGKTLTSRLRLYPRLPLSRIAARDGLLIEHYGDPLLDTARRNFYPDEQPWRFADPRLENVSRIFARLAANDDDDTRDDLGNAVRALRQGRERTRLQVAQAITDAAIGRHEPSAAADLIAAATVERGEPAAATAASSELLAPEIVAVLAGLKPVTRIEGLDRETALARQRELAKSAPVVRLVERRIGNQDRADRHLLYVGRDSDAVENEIRCADTPERSGELLGYPACCVERFAAHAYSKRNLYTPMQISLRVETAGPVSALLNPAAALVNHVPCSLACTDTLRYAEALADALESFWPAGEAARFRERLQNPWLLLVGSEGEAVELRTDAPGERFRYRAGERRGTAPLLQRIVEGDELVVEEQHLLVLRAGRLHAALGGRAYLWWHHAATQVELWRRLLQLRLAAPAPEPGEQTTSEQTTTTVTTDDALLRQVRDVLAPLAAESFAGFRLGEATASHHDCVEVVLTRAGERLRLLIAPRDATRRSYLDAGPFGLTHPSDQPLDTPDAREAIRLLARAIEAGRAPSS